MKTSKRDELLKELKLIHRSKREAIRIRLDEFRRVDPSDYFYELVYCLLTPQTSAESAAKAVEELQNCSFHSLHVDPEPILRRPSMYIRFHRTKSKHLLKLKDDFPLIAQNMTTQVSAGELREWLVKNVLGLGYKEATHFLRNVGKNDGLAILDRHILRNLKRLGAIRSLPKTLTRKHYFAIERAFMRLSDQIAIPLDELDLLFWSMETGVIRK